MSWSKRIRRALSQSMVPKFTVRRATASAMLLPLAFGLTACTRDFTVDYLYVTGSNKGSAGSINEYLVDYQSGALVAISGSPIQTGVNPVALVTTSNGLFVYVVNQGDSRNIDCGAGNGALTSKNTYKTGNTPTGAAIDVA